MQKFFGFAKILIIILLTLSISGSVFVFPQKAEAQITTRIEALVENIWTPIKEIYKKIKDQAAATAFKTALSQFLNKIAYDMAVSVATSAPGQKSLIFDDPNYFINLKDAVIGGAIDEIAQSSGFTDILGVKSLCEPIDLTFKVNLLLSFKEPKEPQKPRCSFSQINKNLAESANSFTHSFTLANLSLRFEMGDLEEARNSLRKSLVVEKYLDSGSVIFSDLSGVLTDLENISDEMAKLIQGIYQKPVDERQAAAEGEIENLNNIIARLLQVQNKTEELKGTIIYCNSSKDNCSESLGIGMCDIFVSAAQPNCSAAASTAQTYLDQINKLRDGLVEGAGNLYDGILEKAFTVPDASDPQDVSNAFNRESSDIGKYFAVKKAKDNDVNIKIENEKLLQQISKDCQPKKDPVSGMNVLPASAACKVFDFAMSKSTANEETYTGIFSQAVSIFTNTLAGKLMQNWFEKGVAALYDKGKKSTNASDLSVSGVPHGKTAAQEKFLTLLRSDFPAGGPFQVLRELTLCPPQGAGPDNCVIDENFSQAISERLTIKEAMDKNLLNPKKPFGYVKSGGKLAEPSYLNGYSYRSMIILRKFRIIPVGWELAAEWIKKNNTNSYSLREVLDCYENVPECIFIKNGQPNPFYHLVDPGWVLLEQPAFCRRQGAGEKILAEDFPCIQQDPLTGKCLEYSRNVFRQEYCADEQTCLSKNEDGSCRFYGYCTEDLPSWKLSGNNCPVQYNSCQVFGNKEGENVSYLEHTISSGGCNVGNADCRWYCEEAPLACSGGAKNGELCSENNDCIDSKGLVDGICKSTDLWKCQGKNLIVNPGVEVNSNGWSDILGSSSNNRVNTGHESFASLSSQSSGAESGFFSIQFSTSAVCIGGSDAGKLCTLNSDCSSVICKNNEAIDASAWVNPSVVSSNLNSGAAIRIRAFDGGASEVQRMESERITNPNIWKPAHISALITNTTAKSFILELISYGNGTTATFDDIGLFRGDRISFDKDVKQCEAKDAGCHEFARTTNGANLIFNPSFEIEENSYAENLAAGSGWYGWHLPAGFGLNGSAARDESTKVSGKASLKIAATAGTVSIAAETADPRNAGAEEFKLMPEDFYSFSISAKANADCPGCLKLWGNCRIGGGGSSQSFDLTAAWQRYSFNYKKDRVFAFEGDECRFYAQLENGGTYWLDDAKLEIGNQSTNHKDYGSEKKYLNESRISCDLSEVGCELYTPANGDIGIPAVAKTKDQCPSECVGYEAFHELPAYFDSVENAQLEELFPSFIPSTAASCPASAVGCEEFTNLDTVVSGGEAKEYYTKLRQCAKPGTTNDAVFYTWEGSEEAGFQLRVWKLKTYLIDSSPFTTDSSAAPPADCDLSDPDCRVFYNQAGTAFRRFLSKTVFISDDCHPLRRTIQGTRADCADSGGRSEPAGVNPFEIVTCYYDVIPSQGAACSAQYAGCREYKGPSGNNEKIVLNNDFENASDPTQGWIGNIIGSSAVSVAVGGKSLAFSAPNTAKYDISSLVGEGQSYVLKFWAKRATSNNTEFHANFDNKLGQADSVIDFSSVILSDEWNFYSIGPADFSKRGPAAAEELIIFADQNFYIDNIKLVEAADDVFVVKKSWKTPISCDLNPDGISETLSVDIDAAQATIPLNPSVSFPAAGSVLIDLEVISYGSIIGDNLSVINRGERGTTPSAHLNGVNVLFLDEGYMLGCSIYADRAKSTHNLKSFSKLCREDHVGCELLTDTQNTRSPFSEWKSAEYAPADTLAPIVNDKEKYCDAKAKGCKKFGQPSVNEQDSAVEWNNVYLLNNPDSYDEILCQNSENWCAEYKIPNGGVKYFKDPGQKLCEYKEGVGVGSSVVSGWFINGDYSKVNPDECLNAMRHCKNERQGSYLFCRTDSDCDVEETKGVIVPYGPCVAKSTEWARLCPEDQSSCTEYKDPLFPQTQGANERYYYLADQQDEGKCQGKIDEEQKCVAFNDTEDPIRNARASGVCKANSAVYCATNADCRRPIPDGTGNIDDTCLMKSDRPFDPQACTKCSVDKLACGGAGQLPCCDSIMEDLTVSPQIMPACNANEIFYVSKDRDCREWLACSSSGRVTNARGESENICFDVARCTELDPVTGACKKRSIDNNFCQNPKCNMAKNQCLLDASVWCGNDADCSGVKRICSADNQCSRSVGPCDLVSKTCKDDAARACAKDSDCMVEQGPCVTYNQTFDNPIVDNPALDPEHQGVIDDLRFKSGFNPYGVHWLNDIANAADDQTRGGEYDPTEAMQKGQTIVLEDGDFEKQNSSWKKFSVCNVNNGVSCVDNSSCLAGDACDSSTKKCTVSGNNCFECSVAKNLCSVSDDCASSETCGPANSRCSVADSCGGVCSKNNSIRCRNNNDCGVSGTCDLSAKKCFVTGNACPSGDFDCGAGDFCRSTTDFSYERIKVLSGLKSLKLDAGESVYQGNYPSAIFPAALPITVSGNTQISFSGYANTIDLKNGDARAIIQEFSSKATNGKVLPLKETAVIIQAIGKPWKFYAGIFTTQPETVSIRVILKNGGTGGYAYFDNFLMLPVLHYQTQSYPIPFLEAYDSENPNRPGGNPFIGRSCRLYPQTNAPACFYTDGQKQQFSGWRGFCVEPDPNNPLQCLQWLPIDQLQGEGGFGFKTESSYSGKAPLYYCAEMSLWQLRCNDVKYWSCSRPNESECPVSAGTDPSCPNTYYRGGGKVRWGKCTGESYCHVRGMSVLTATGNGATDMDCAWVPYRSCPYGTKDKARTFPINLIGRCDKLVETVDNEGQNISWNNRISQKSFQLMSPYGYIYNADQNNPLYGSIMVMGQPNSLPDTWQNQIGRDFITFGSAGACAPSQTCVRNIECGLGEECKLNGAAYECFKTATSVFTGTPCDIRKDTNLTRSVSGFYPLWILPKSEDDAAPSENACMISSGGSPLACSNPYCYNMSPRTPPDSAVPGYADLSESPWCTIDQTTKAPNTAAKAFELNVTQTVQSPNCGAGGVCVAGRCVGGPTPGQECNSIENNNMSNNDTFIQGSKRLQHLFGKSYSIWVWNSGKCVDVMSSYQCVGTNELTGSSCNPIDTGYACSNNANRACFDPTDDQACPGGSCVQNIVLNSQCNAMFGKCTPAGGGVCMDAASGYPQKTCAADCLGGSCAPKLECSSNGAACPSVGALCDWDAVGEVYLGVCNNIGNRCSTTGAACNPTTDCSPVGPCPGGSVTVDGDGNCICAGGVNAGNFCWGDPNFNDGCPGGSCDAATGKCSLGDRDTQSCGYTPVCTDKRCTDAGGGQYGFCVDDLNCVDTPNTTCLPLLSQICFPGGISGYCGGGVNGGLACTIDADCPGSKCDKDYEMFKSCTVDAECAGTTLVDQCIEHKYRCALWNNAGVPDANGMPIITGVEKAGQYCLGNVGADDINGDTIKDTECAGIINPNDDGVCVKKWCEDGINFQQICTDDSDCVVLNDSFGNAANKDTYVSVSDVNTTIQPRFRDAVWMPSTDQCPTNQRPQTVQPPIEDLLSFANTAEMCGVAPRITNFQIGAGGRADQASGDVSILPGDSVTVSFNALIDAEQRPIKYVAVDWGNPVLGQTTIGPYADGTGLTPKTLADDPFIFISPPYPGACPITAQTPNGECIIKVMVQDNWLWCNGGADLKGYSNGVKYCSGNTTQSCANDLPDCAGAGKCSILGCATTDHWLPFPGKIIIQP